MSKEKNLRMIHSLDIFSSMVGEKKTGGEHPAGLGMTFQSGRCMEEARAIKEGLFKVVVMGSFSSGKSTLVNALLGQRILPESPLPSTAILTAIQYGNDEDDVEIHYKGIVNADGSVTEREIEHISKNEFNSLYQYTKEDNEEFATTGKVTRLKDISHSIVHSSLPLTENGVSLIDSPGLEDKSVATDMTLLSANEAHAIVYVCGERGFAESDREFFGQNFKGNPGNVFFVINKIDNIVSEAQREQALERVRNDVKTCFTMTDGSVDEELMNKRVFGISALMALDSRSGTTFDEDLQQYVSIDPQKAELKMQRSNFIPFEEALREFLMTGERVVAQYGKIFRTMVDTYSDAKKKVSEDMDFYVRCGKMSAERKADCQRIIGEIETRLQAAETSFDNCTLKLRASMSTVILDAVDNIDNTWDIDLEKLHKKICFGMKDYLSVGLNNINFFKKKEDREKEMKRLLEPFSKIIADYLTEKIDQSVSDNRYVIERDITEAGQQVNANLQKVSELFLQLGKTFSEKPEADKGNKQDWIQAIISYFAGDASAIVKNCVGGKVAWTEFLTKAVFNALWQIIILNIVTGGWGVVICALIEWLQINNGKSNMINKMLTQCKDSAVKAIRGKMEVNLKEMGDKIATVMNKVKEEKCGDSRKRLADERNRLSEIERNIQDNTFTAEREKKRTDYILSVLNEELKNCHEYVFGTPLEVEVTKI